MGLRFCCRGYSISVGRLEEEKGGRLSSLFST